MNKSKQLGQVITPAWIVNEILDACHYAGCSILRRYVLEPACGNGAFLSEMVSRYIVAAKAEQQSNEQIAAELAQYIVGVELDPVAYADCITRLNHIVQQELGLPNIAWRIHNQNTLDFYRDYVGYFDWVVGNPPYIRLHRLDEAMRARLKQQFRFTHGTTDMYLAFFEMAFAMLNPKGKLGFITPNSFLHNTSYQAFRQFLQQQGHLIALYDFKSNKLFEGFSTYTAISIFDKQHQQSDFAYLEYQDGKCVTVNRIAFHQLNPKKWTLASSENAQFLQRLQTGTQLGDLFNVQYGFATLRDKIFIAKATPIDETHSQFNGFNIENAILRPIVKGSRYKGLPEDIEHVVFPYYLCNGRYVAYTEADLAQQFPLAYAYLLHHKQTLSERDIDKNVQWFEFGRSQGLQTSHSEKIVVSTLFYDCITLFRLPKNVLVYSGIFITQKQPAHDWEIAENALRSPEFFHYARLTGKDMSGGYKSLSSKQIKGFALPISCPNSLF